MAGSGNRAEQLHAARQEIEQLRDQYRQLAEIVAREAPHLLEQDKPEPVTEYTPEVADQIIALADLGLTEAEWIASLGISADTWREWLASFPDLDDAAARARARLLAWVAAVERQAIQKGYHSVPSQVLRDIKADARRFERVDAEQGDAAPLVRVTVSTGSESKPQA